MRTDAAITTEPSFLEIDLPRFEANCRHVRDLLDHHAADRPDPLHRPAADRRPPLLCAVVKKDAYGLGLDTLAQRLARCGADILATYSADGATAIMKAGINIPMLLLSPLRSLKRTDPLYRAAETGRLHLSIHDPQQLDQLNAIGQTFGLKLPVHLYLDTGMSRSGLSATHFAHALAKLPNLPHVKLRGIYSHLATACSDHEYAYRQLDYFEQLIAAQHDAIPPSVVLHIANTCATLRDSRFHLDMARVGLGLYGYGPESITAGPVLGDAPILHGILRWLSKITHLQHYPRGASVGYGCTHTLKRDSLLGVVPVGYGDGYPLALSNVAHVRVPLYGRGPIAFCPVLGRVNMDQIVIDLTDPAAIEPPRLLEEVEVIGNDPAAPNAVPHLADLAKSSPYEILCRLSPRLPRKYLKTSPTEPD